MRIKIRNGKTGGRAKGTPNKVTTDLRTWTNEVTEVEVTEVDVEITEVEVTEVEVTGTYK
jgi:hypothetical protein